MICQDAKIYVIGKGFVNLAELSVEDQVYTLAHKTKVEIKGVESVYSGWYEGKINVIDSGMHRVNSTKSTKHLYISETYGCKYLNWNEIPSLTPNKEYKFKSFLPVLSWPYLQNKRNLSDEQIEYFARGLAVSRQAFDSKLFRELSPKMTGEDALVFVDMIEYWCSIPPGIGWLDNVQAKSRSHVVYDEYTQFEIAKLAVLAGYTSAVSYGDKNRYVTINYESTPIPGSRPKNEKYYNSFYIGNIFQINADNRPILGMSNNKCFYLPFSSDIIST